MSVEEKAINLLQSADIDETGDVQWHTWYKGIDKDIKKAFDVAIKALEQEPILDKVKAEIEQERVGYPPSADYYKAIMKCLQIIDKCKAEKE